MNKQDAIEILEEVKMFDDSMYSFKPAYLEALDIAIDALKVDAIPVEWIRKYTKDCDNGFAWDVFHMVQDWKKEQRKDE